jgi:four helix bundle protein
LVLGSDGTGCAGRLFIVVKRFEDFAVWQLSRELERRVFASTATSPANRDLDYCRQVRKSSSSPARNIAEGFGRFWPADFARFVRIARGSLEETKDHVDADRRFHAPCAVLGRSRQNLGGQTQAVSGRTARTLNPKNQNLNREP